MAALVLSTAKLGLGSSPISHRLLLAKAYPALSVNLRSAEHVNKRDVHLTPARQGELSPHATHWIVERGAAMALLAIIPAAYFVPQSFTMDTILTTTLVLHSHWGIAGVFGDYVHGYPSQTGERRYPLLGKFAKVAPYVLSVTAFACLMNFNYNDVGLVNAIAMLWRV